MDYNVRCQAETQILPRGEASPENTAHNKNVSLSFFLQASLIVDTGWVFGSTVALQGPQRGQALVAAAQFSGSDRHEGRRLLPTLRTPLCKHNTSQRQEKLHHTSKYCE